MPQAAVRAAVDHLVRQCSSLKKEERALIVCDEQTVAVARAFETSCAAVGSAVEFCEIPIATMHGQEPPSRAARSMAEANVIFGLTTFSIAHTAARKNACERGARYLSLPEYSFELLCSPAIMVDYQARAPLVRKFADAFTRGATVRVTSELGTDIQLDIRGREGNYCPGFVQRPGELGSPPDIEANVSPVETASDGIIVVDGSVPCAEIGLLHQPLRLEVRGGRVVGFDGENKDVVSKVEQLFAGVGSDRAYVLAECGVGLNDAAELTGIMLTDEGAAGCLHFGFGSNATVGGKNSVPFHLDFVFRNGSLAVDDVQLIDKGKFC